jgi:hypothetical protein
VSGDAYNNHGQFRGRHSVVITRDYGVWRVEGDEGDNWVIARQIVETVEQERRDRRDERARWVFGVAAFFSIVWLSSGASIGGTSETVLLCIAALAIGGLLGAYFARPRELPRLAIYDRIRTKHPKARPASSPSAPQA